MKVTVCLFVPCTNTLLTYCYATDLLSMQNLLLLSYKQQTSAIFLLARQMQYQPVLGTLSCEHHRRHWR